MRRPIIYFSGVDREAHIKLLAQERAAGMVNAADVMQPELLGTILRYPCVPMVLDSGFESKPSFDGYMAARSWVSDARAALFQGPP